MCIGSIWGETSGFKDASALEMWPQLSYLNASNSVLNDIICTYSFQHRQEINCLSSNLKGYTLLCDPKWIVLQVYKFQK